MKHGERLVRFITRHRNNKNPLSFRYRYDPVPFTGKVRGYSLLRKINTKQERTYNENCPYTRAKRKNKNLPDDWEDITRADFRDCCWKRQKKRKQWM